jgi:PAS domain S-box-containing protein
MDPAVPEFLVDSSASARELGESETRFRQIAENIHAVFWITEPTTNTLIYVSPAYEEIWGRPAGEILGDREAFLRTIHPEDRAHVFATADDVAGGRYWEHYRIVRPDGEVRWIEDRGFPVFGADGSVHRIVGFADDITDRVRREQPHLDPPDAAAERPSGGVERVGVWREQLGARSREVGDGEDLLRSHLLNALHLGQLQPGDRLPSVRDLASDLGIGYHRALRDYRALVEEGVLEARDRSGFYAAEPTAPVPEALNETAEWVADIVSDAVRHQIRLPLLPDLLRRYAVRVPLTCACIDDALDYQRSLCWDAERHLGLHSRPVSPDVLPLATRLDGVTLDDLAAPLREADLWITTVYHARAVRSLGERVGKPVVVGSLAPDLVGVIEEQLRRRVLSVICVDPAFGERVRAVGGGRYGSRVRVVPADDAAAVAALDPGEPVLLTRAAHERLGNPALRLVAPLSPWLSPRFARELAVTLVRFHTGAGAA